jgi:hypothetical protein
MYANYKHMSRHACTCDATQQSHQMVETHQREAAVVYIYTKVPLLNCSFENTNAERQRPCSLDRIIA